MNHHDIKIFFHDCPELLIKIDDTELGRRYIELVKKNYAAQPQAIFRDPQRYDINMLSQLIDQANQCLGWHWQIDDLDLSKTVTMHKDIERFLSQGYHNIPEQYDDLLHELHFCLHSVEANSQRDNWFQIEWFNDDGFDLPQDQYPAKIALEFGDIRLQNPYVGHHPMYLFQQQDNINIDQTCRFHDLVRPGICLVIHDAYYEVPWQEYTAWFQQHAPGFVAKHGMDKIIAYTGHPVIGRVINLSDLEYCVSRPYLEFHRLEFANE